MHSSAIHSLLFHDTTFHLALALFVSLRKKMELVTSSHPPIPNMLLVKTSYSDVLLSVILSCPLAALILRPDYLLRLWCYINPLLTYLLTYLSCYTA